MSEYQYYEFQAINKPLTDKDRQALRNLSTRARITNTSFINEYHWGDFKGNPVKLMEKYFDAFLYFANWGTHQFMLRIPKKFIDVELANKYCIGDSATIYEKDDYLIFEFSAETEDYEYYDYEEEESLLLSSLVFLRSDIIHGDYRCLYLAWLLCVQMNEVDEDSYEPLVPANLKNLNASLKSFVDFMKIDTALIEAAAENSISEEEKTEENPEELKVWIAALSESEKNEIIFQLINENDQHQGTTLMQRFQKSISALTSSKASFKPRKVQELIKKAEIITEEREHRIAEQKATEKARQNKKAEEKREKHLADLAKQGDKVWKRVNDLVETKKPSGYDEAVKLLVDLRDISHNESNFDKFKEELNKIYEKHSKKTSFIERLKTADLTILKM